MILYTLSRVNFPLTNSQLTSFILDKDYTNYFNIQQVISELIDDSYVTNKTIRNSSLYFITETGKDTLSLFDNMMSSGIKEDVDAYLLEKHYELREEVSTLSNYYQVKKGEFAARLRVYEQGTPFIDITLNVTTEEEAIRLCNNWKNKSSEIYTFLISTLLE